MALNLIANQWEQPRGPRTGDWLNKVWYIPKMECNIATKSEKDPMN